MRLEHSIYVAMRGRYINDPNSRVSGLPTKQRLEIGVDGGDVLTALTTVLKDSMILEKYTEDPDDN